MFLSSLYFALLAKLNIWQTTESYSPQTFSVTAAVVAPAVVIRLNSLVFSWYNAIGQFQRHHVPNHFRAQRYCVLRGTSEITTLFKI